jgi:hypothetical protein
MSFPEGGRADTAGVVAVPVVALWELAQPASARALHRAIARFLLG